ncbi:MipA/OmpV family protein [Sphaerotilaceae bacterium SBD11-9]
MTLRLVAAGVLLVASWAARAQEPAQEPAQAPSTPPEAASDADARPLITRPLWELGVGISAVRLPDYRGSDQSQNYFLPFPYVVYRGSWLRADRDGTRARLFDSPNVRVDLSFGATAPTSSNKNEAREGMPNLPATVEVGPNLNITLDRAADKRWKLDLRVPLRAAMSLEWSPRYVGATLSPNLNLDISEPDSWNLGFLTGPLFADRKYHEQFYSVDAPYATATRPAYQARGGYAGWQLLGSASKRFGITWVGLFARYDSLHGAVFEDSPLVRRSASFSAGIAVSWVLSKSTEMVSRPE